MTQSTTNTNNNNSNKDWIRGVNIGGWLVLERFITPYTFALTSCHVAGDFCYYKNQVDAPPNTTEYCDLQKCTPLRTISVTGELDYPVDEDTLMAAFGSDNKETAKRYLNSHYEHFVTKTDVQTLHHHGVTHVRVPMGHWILGHIEHETEPYVHADGWKFFIRFVGWCREFGIQVWPDLHTAPGSQNGFDNSGHLLAGDPTCEHWSGSPFHVARTLQILKSIVQQIKKDGLEDVVTGLGILNEPFVDCHVDVVRQYNNDALGVVRNVLGPETSIYIGDLFNATKWNDGWWQQGGDSDASGDSEAKEVVDVSKYEHTFLDSHYYHVFAEQPRALSPRQHIAYVCRHNFEDTVGCCYDDYENATNTIPSKTISRIIGEWSASFDTLVVAKLDTVMEAIAVNGTALEMDRQLSPLRKDFVRHFVEAQMVTYEAEDVGVSSGWFFWTLKMEGGAFAEWDFLRGLKEGWIPSIPSPQVASKDLYGTCEDIIFKVKDDSMAIVNEFPDPSTLDPNNWQGVAIDDDLVVSHGQSLFEVDDILEIDSMDSIDTPPSAGHFNVGSHILLPLAVICCFAYGFKRSLFGKAARGQYTSINGNGASTNGTVSLTV